jgi:hypothetical protein
VKTARPFAELPIPKLEGDPMTRLLVGVVTWCFLGVAFATAADTKLTYVDLQPQANQKLADSFGSGVEGNNLAELPKGEQTFAGIKFKIDEGAIQLGSKVLDKMPEKVTIPVNRAFATLHLLHATQYGGGPNKPGDDWFVEDNTPIGEYRVQYEDSSTVLIPIVYGQDVRDWFYVEGEKEPSRSKVAWKGSNGRAPQVGARIRLYLSSWENPSPAKKVTAIEYTSRKDQTVAAPFCVALTLEEKPEKAVQAVTKWEYKIVRAVDNPTAMEAILNKLGEEGWECVGTVSRAADGRAGTRGGGTQVICKRPKR